MIIGKRAIQAFLARARDDLRPFKQLNDAQLEQWRATLPQPLPIWGKLWRHQKIALMLALSYQRLSLFADVGVGKTLVAMAFARYLQRSGAARRFLVLVPRRANKDEWEREIRKHSRRCSYEVLRGTMAERRERLFASDALLVVETYGALVQMLCEKVQRGGRNKLEPSAAMLARLRRFDGVVADEIHMAKNAGTLTFRILRQLARRCRYMLLMTGTPFGRDPIDLWSQLYLTDGGWALGETLGLYRAVFFRQSVSAEGEVTYEFDRRKQRMLHRCLAHSSIVFEAGEYDLPQVVRQIKRVDLDGEAESYVARARDMVRAAGGSFSELKNAFVRMRQISSGWIGYHDDDLGERASVMFAANPKLDLLLDLLRGLDPARKVIVYNEFHTTGDLIAARLAAAAIPHVRIYGKTADVTPLRDRFQNDSSCRVLLLSNAMAVGLNLQAADAGFVFESPVSVIQRKQAIGRFVRRASQHRRVFLYDLVTHGTYDDAILRCHQTGADLYAALMRGDFGVLR